MPSKYSLKSYVPDGYYHVFNRGIDGRNIFEHPADYEQLLQYIIEGLEPRSDDELRRIVQDNSIHYKKRREAARTLQRKNYSNEIKLFAFNLESTHFSIILQQRNKDSMQEFMRSILTRYSMYFNKKYKRKGSLFESAYKAIQITSDIQMLEIIKDMFKNKAEREIPEELMKYSSHYYYRHIEEAPDWHNLTLVLSLIKKRYPDKDYSEFIRS